MALNTQMMQGLFGLSLAPFAQGFLAQAAASHIPAAFALGGVDELDLVALFLKHGGGARKKNLVIRMGQHYQYIGRLQSPHAGVGGFEGLRHEAGTAPGRLFRIYFLGKTRKEGMNRIHVRTYT